MKKYLRLYWLFIKYSVMHAITYRASFVVWSLISIVWTLLLIAFYEILFLNVDTIAGWTKSQVLLVQGFYFMIEMVMWGMMWENMRQIPEKINKGTMDLELLKPVNHQFMLSFKTFSLDNMNNFVLGVATIGYALKIGNVTPNLSSFSLALASFILACIFIYSAWFSTMCIAFWFDRIENLYHLFPALRNFWKIPQPFFKGFLRTLFTFVIPITLVTTVPTEFLLGRFNWLNLLVLFVFAIASLFFSRWFFSVAVKRYSGASA